MIGSLALVFFLGIAAARLFAFLRLPRMIGMLLCGILLGPCGLGLLDPSILGISSELRQMALVIILIKAGLLLDLSDLKKVGKPAVLLSCLPASCEILGYCLFAPSLLGISRTEAALLGCVMGAVSPAVVVPKMTSLIEQGIGTAKQIPQMILAGASCDDIFVIVLFGAFADMAAAGEMNASSLFEIPVSAISGLLIGLIAGALLAAFFERCFQKNRPIRNSEKLILILGVSFSFLAAQSLLEHILPLSGMLAVIAMACMLRIRLAPCVTQRLCEKFGKLWIAAEILLFVLVGAAVDLPALAGVGRSAVLLIAAALLFRCAGVSLCLTGTPLTLRERIFCAIAYLPKATVQAAIGSVPLAMGLSCGQLVLSVSVAGILLTAPLGAIGMELAQRPLLEQNAPASSDR